MTVPSLSLPRARLLAAAIVATVVVALGWSNVALAHTDFESSMPSDQEIVAGPLDQVIVDFTNPANVAGEGFELPRPVGDRPNAHDDRPDGRNLVRAPVRPATHGRHLWSAMEGPGGRCASDRGVVHLPGHLAASGVFARNHRAPTTVPVVAAPTTRGSTVPAVVAPITSLDDFLASDATGDDTAAVGRVGRAITFLGTIFGVGALAALVWVIRGRRDEILTQLSWIRLAGIVIATGGLIELAALQTAQDVAVGQLVDTKAGLAAVLKLVGGVVVWFGLHGRAGRVTGPAYSLSAAVPADLAARSQGTTRFDDVAGDHRWSPTSTSAIGLAGYALVLASFWFDGHTVSKGPWAVHSLVNLVHLGAAAVWGGGVFAMTTVAWHRRRHSQDVGLATMVVRFSTLATASLIAVIVAGVTMTVLILDTPADLVATTWGRILVAKTLAVAVAAGMGAYNHFKLRPASSSRPPTPDSPRNSGPA